MTALARGRDDLRAERIFAWRIGAMVKMIFAKMHAAVDCAGQGFEAARRPDRGSQIKELVQALCARPLLFAACAWFRC
jgi:hypothetical protein